MDPDDVGGGSTLASWIARLWTRLDDPGEWFVLADWLAERRDPRAVLLRQALGGGRLDEAGTHWTRLREVHRANGFDDVGGLPWDLSFLIAARELLRVPAVSNFAALVDLLGGLSPTQWTTVRPSVSAALEGWPDRFRRAGAHGANQFSITAGAPPYWWSLVRAADVGFPWIDEPPAPQWVTSLTTLEVYYADGERDLEWVAGLPIETLEMRGAEVALPSFPFLRRLVLQGVDRSRDFLAEEVHGCVALEDLTVVGAPRSPLPLDVSMLGSGALADTLRVLRLVNQGLPTDGEPQWSSFRRLEHLALLQAKAPLLGPLFSRVLPDPTQLPRLRRLDLRWTRVRGRQAPLPGRARLERLEQVGTSLSRWLAAGESRAEPLPALRRLSLAGGSTLDPLRTWLASPRVAALGLERLDLHVDASSGRVAAWADALDRWPRIHTLTLPAGMVRRSDDVARWLGSSTFRSLEQLNLHGVSAGLRPLAEAMADAGMSPRVYCDLGFRSGAPRLLRRAGFVVDRLDDLGVAVDERDWSAPDLR
ncbi:MAG: hypothetical protein AAF211_31295 [Myxococcota bacterium]